MGNGMERDLLLDLIEHIGKDWEENSRPENIGYNVENIEVLRKINAAVTSNESGLTPDLLREKCPSFVRVYRDVMLRDIEEQIPNGIDQEEGYPA